MSVSDLSKFPSSFITSTKKKSVPIYFFDKAGFKKWLTKQDTIIKNQIKQNGFECAPKHSYDVKDAKGKTKLLISGVASPVYYLDSASVVSFIQSKFSSAFLSKHVFEVKGTYKQDDLNKIFIGWGLANYKFDRYIDKNKSAVSLKWHTKADKKTINATVESISLIRNLINTPANDLGTDELASIAKNIAEKGKAKISVIKGKKIETDFPMIHAVGKASPRPPQLVDIKWGKKSDPKITIVGKGIIYDTGGLNLKPGMYMRDMKKDMGGAAHALGLAHMIMSMKLPVQLRVLLPIAENSVAGNSFRPGDVINSRKGVTVEIGDTDAEGRLVVGDAVTYACEDKPDLLIDFCTLTGAARVALGYDIPAFFTNQDEFLEGLRTQSVEKDDPVWPLPLWQGYKKELGSNVADMTNDGSGRAGAIHGALFIERFIDSSIDWVHLDCFAWEQHGKAGRPKGGADTGMRAIFEFIKSRYT